MSVGQRNSSERSALKRLSKWVPGLPALIYYERGNFKHDLIAGLSIAAVAFPVSIAYAQLAGFDPVVGLYSSILPLVAYAFFGTSRQLVVNPDAATCAMIAAAIAPMAANNPESYHTLAIALTLLTGIYCIGASMLRLGAIADFLSRPILVGFLNGIAISIFLGQVGKLGGFPVEAGGILPRIIEISGKVSVTHVPTLMVSVASFLVLLLTLRFFPYFPAALVVMAVAAAVSAAFDLAGSGINILGPVPPGLPDIRWPTVPLEHLPSLAADAAGLALVLFTSGTLSARSFAAKGGYQIDVDREFTAYGAANIASALSQGFAVTGADSRTAVGVAAGARSQMSGLVAAAALAIVLLFLTAPLQYIPIASLAVVLVFAAFSLFDIAKLREFWRIDRLQFGLSILTMIGVVAVGPINGILIAVGLALARFVKQTARPRDESLGKVEGLPGFHSLERHPSAQDVPGLVLYRFNGPLTFFNAEYFRQRALEAADEAGSKVNWFVIDVIPITDIDVDGLYALRQLDDDLSKRGTLLVLAGRKTELLESLRQNGLYRPEHERRIFPTLRQALKSYQLAMQSAG